MKFKAKEGNAEYNPSNVSFNVKRVKIPEPNVPRYDDLSTSGILVWGCSSSDSSFIHLFKCSRDGELSEYFSMFNYKGPVCDACLLPELPFRLVVMNYQGELYRVTVSDDNTIKVEAYKHLNVSGMKDTEKPIGIKLFKSHKNENYDMLIINERAIKTYEQDDLNLRGTEQCFKGKKICAFDDRTICVIADLPSLPRPSVNWWSRTGMMFSRTSTSNAGIQLFQKGISGEYDVLCLESNLTPYELSVVEFSDDKKYLACADVTGNNYYIYSIEGDDKQKRANLKKWYYRGASQSDTQQILFSRKNDVVVIVSTKTVRFIPLGKKIEKDSDQISRKQVSSEQVSESSVLCVKYNEDTWIRVAEVCTPNNVSSFIIATKYSMQFATYNTEGPKLTVQQYMDSSADSESGMLSQLIHYSSDSKWFKAKD